MYMQPFFATDAKNPINLKIQSIFVIIIFMTSNNIEIIYIIIFVI